MQLTAKTCETAQPRGQEYLLADGNDLYLLVLPNGTKSWRFIYTAPGGRRRKKSLGTFPKVVLATARQRAREEHQLLAAGKDPLEDKIEKRLKARQRDLSTFENVAREWLKHESHRAEWSASYKAKIQRMLELHAFPDLGRYSLAALRLENITTVLNRVALAGTRETATRLREKLVQVYAYAVTQSALLPQENFMAKGVADLKLPKPKTKHRAAILEPARVGQLLRDMRAYDGHIIVRCLLRLMPLLFQRPGQTRFMQWDQLELDDGIWNCPPELMKQTSARRALGGGGMHVVPLPRQAVSILRELLVVTGPAGPVFKSLSRRSEETRFVSENTVNAALRNMGYSTQDEITGHGFRAMARTLVRERLGFDSEVIEAHLASPHRTR